VRRVLFSMLCEDAYLHTAKSIVLLWPHFSEPEDSKLRVKIGHHAYEVRIVRRPVQTAGAQDIVGLAFDVRSSKRTSGNFADFCISLFAGYGWVARHIEPPGILFENEGEALKIWAMQSADRTFALIRSRPEYGKDGEIVVVNHTITNALRREATTGGWYIIHYAEIGRFLQDHFNDSLFDQW
jgi:hypothetical protein